MDDPRPQLLIIVDTDAPTLGQIRDDPTLSADAAIDTVRVDFIASGSAYATQTFTVTETSDWPLSFGVRAPSESVGETVRVRIRGFRGVLADVEQIGEAIELSPPPEVSIDRLVELSLPSAEVVTKSVRLSLACLGRPPSFLTPGRSCIDAEHLDALATAGVEEGGSSGGTGAGSSELAWATDCGAASDDGRVCVPGGFVLLGDTQLVGIDDVLRADAVPLRPARISPFWLDGTEVTVGEIRALFAQLTSPAPLPFDTSLAQQAYCTWLGPDVDDNDALPANCIAWETARQVCQLKGGDLPTEAQWEHAASGRGQSRRYPWGDQAAECCDASLDRLLGCKDFADFPEPAGSHPREGCAGPGDVARDGALDMGGSVAEWMLDHFRDYGEDGCWTFTGIGFDPSCDEEGSTRSQRGGNWSGGLGTPLAALRLRASGPAATTGFRCRYEDQP